MASSSSYASVRREMKAVGLRNNIWNNIVIASEALDRGIQISTYGRGNSVVMRHGGKKHFWRMGTNSLNSALAVKCTDLKEVTSRLLRAAGVNAPEGAIFEPHDVERAWAWAEPIAPVVIKPNNSMQGIGVFMDLDNWEDFNRAFSQAASGVGEILVERFQPGNDHRVLVVDNQVVAATRRIAANVTGDGESTITELVATKNKSRPRSHKQIVLDDIVERYLERREQSLDSVPAEGETVFLRGTVNMHTGGDTIDATDDLTLDQIRQVEAGAQAIPGLGVGGFDLLVPDDPEDGASSILEINSNPMISMQHFPAIGKPRNAARAVLNAMYPDTARPMEAPKNAPPR